MKIICLCTRKNFNYFNIKYKEELELKNYRIINKQIWIDYENDKIGFEHLRIERFKRLFENYEEKIDFDEFSKRYFSLLAGGIYLIDGAEEVCKYLFKKYKVGHYNKGTTLSVGDSLSSDIQGGIII